MRKRSNTMFDDMMLTIDNTAIIAIQTAMPHFEIAYHLNNIYKLDLWRREDLKVEPATGSLGVSCPLFFYNDPLKYISYILLDISSAPHLIANTHTTCNILFLANGTDSWEFVERLASDLSEPLPDSHGETEATAQRCDFINALRQSILTCRTIDLREAKKELDEDDWVVQKQDSPVKEENMLADEYDAVALDRGNIMQASLFDDIPPVAASQTRMVFKRKNVRNDDDPGKKISDIETLLMYIESYFAAAEKDDAENESPDSPLFALGTR